MQLKKVNLIAPSLYQEKLSDLFSKEVAHNSSSGQKYLDRTKNGVYMDKIISDIYLGKMAEFAVFNYLANQDKTPTFPDIAIYPSKKKSYDADIFVGETKIHVKCCVFNDKFDNSWVFRPNDPIVKDPDDKDFVALCILENNQFTGMFAKASQLVGMHKPARNPNYQMAVIYESDLK